MRLRVAPSNARPTAGATGFRFARLAASVFLVFTGCESGSQPAEPPPPDSTGDGGTIQRADLTLTVTLSGEAAAVAGALGMAPGLLEGAEVIIRRIGGSAADPATSDSLGRATFERLLPGHYEVTAARLLDSSEAERVTAALGDEYSDVNALGGGGFVEVTAPSTAASLEAIAGRRGSVVISEFFSGVPRDGTNSYRFATFLEFYNNADTTVYLDGMILARGLWYPQERPERSCSVLDPWRLDPDGVWTERYLQFPGSGRSFPLRPGQTAVMATDAIDHSEFWPGMFDLSRARFESIGSNDIDNPSVPNMRDLGPRRWDNPLGHGWFPEVLFEFLVLVAPLDPAELPRDQLPVEPPEFHRLPADKVLDVISLTAMFPEDNLYPYCDPLTHPSFERLPAGLASSVELTSVRRRVLTTLSNGQVILQRTRTSARDLHRSAPSPFEVP